MIIIIIIIIIIEFLTSHLWLGNIRLSWDVVINRIRLGGLICIIIIIIRYGCLLSQAFSSRYFSWTSGDPHCSGFKLHTAVLSVLCVMFQVQLSFVVNLSNVFPVQFPNFTIPVAPIITGTIVHFRFHIRCISIHKLLHFNFFSASFCTTFLSAGIATSISVHVFSFLFLIIIAGLLASSSFLFIFFFFFFFFFFLLLLLLLCFLWNSLSHFCKTEVYLFI